MPLFTFTSVSRDTLAKLALWLFIILLASTCSLFYYETYREKQVYAGIKQAIKKSASIHADQLISDIDQFKKSVALLSELPSVIRYLNIEPTTTNNDQQSLRADIASAFSAYLKRESSIRQARLITFKGDEYVRVDRSNDTIRVTPFNLLQSKSDKAYFNRGIRLADDELYISNISPNYEYGEIEQPLWPTYRVVKALKNSANENIGILILNIDATNTLDSLNTHIDKALNTFQFDHYLVNQNGYYAAAPNKRLLFGEDLDKPENNWFWQTNNQIQLAHQDTFTATLQSQQHLFFSMPFSLSGNKNGNAYYLLAAISIDQIDSFIESQRHNLFLSLALFSIVVILIICLALIHIRNLEGLYLNQSRFKAIVSNSSDAILSINQKGIIQSWNYASSLLFGLKEEIAIGQSFFDLIHEAESLNEEYLAGILHSNSNDRLEVQHKSNTQQKRILLLTLCPIQKKEGDNESIALIIRDITFQKDNQEKLEAANRTLDADVKKRTEQLESEKLKAIKANDTKSMFVANISHEIRTPLNGISGLLTLARDKANKQKQDEYLRMAQESTQTLNILINDLLDLSKMESGKFELTPKPTNLKHLLESIISSVFFLIKDKNVELILDTSKVDASFINIDDNRIRQVLTNLLSNAIKFTSQGEVYLSASTFYRPDTPDTLECEFQICDSGVGIPEDQQALLFRPFIQASSNIASEFGGTGLGLSISKQLCEMMGGTIELESKMGEGSTFKATILTTKAESEASSQTIDIKTDSFDNISVALKVNNPSLRRVLRNTFSHLNIPVRIISDIEMLKEVKQYSAQDILVLEDDCYEPQLHAALKQHCASIIYLCRDNTLSDKTSDAERLNKPILPSELLRKISITQQEDQSAAPVEQKPDVPKLNMHDKKIFIVDDNEINRIVAKGILEKIGADIDLANNGQDIIQKLKALDETESLPVILMDCQMPVLNGYEATRLIREGQAGEWLKAVPIIALTADAMHQNIEECKAAGMDDFLGKPFDSAVLKARVQHWA